MSLYIIRLPESQETPSPLTLTQLNVDTQVQPIDEFLFITPRYYKILKF
jgi:hypothetical protein